MKRKNPFVLLILLLCMTVLLAGCRTRTTGTEPQAETAAQGELSGTADPDAESGPLPDGISDGLPENGDGNPEPDAGEPGEKTKENPDASRKEYDESAPVEVVPGTDRALHSEGEGNGSPLDGEDAQDTVSRLDDRAGKTASLTVPAREAAQTGTDPEAEEADSALSYFTALISEKMGSLFECQRLNVYWETVQDRVTVFRTSGEHSLILNAGAYDVSSRLLEENLKVDDGWVVRKNPGIIVKIVDSSILGSGVSTPGAAEAVYRGLLGREGWSGIDAVKNRRVVLLSEELLQAPYLQAAAMLIIAGTANPDVFSDVSPDDALKMLAEDATGTLPVGIYYYLGGK